MDSAFKKLIYWSGHTHSLLGLAVHQHTIFWQTLSHKSLNCLWDSKLIALSKITPKFLAVSEQHMFDPPPTELEKSCNEATLEKMRTNNQIFIFWIIYFKRFVTILGRCTTSCT